MLQLEERIHALEKLGRFMSQYQDERADEDLKGLNAYFLEGYRAAIEDAQLFNHWFSEENLHHALEAWSENLSLEQLQKWVSRYPKEHLETGKPKRVAIIMAGNIPLVGFHDLISVLISGHRVLAKPSSDDEKLMPYLAQVLVAIDKRFASYLHFAEGKLQDFEAVIATGSNNSARYFEYYFGKYPHIIRKNRSSVALLTGEESEAELTALGEDIFRYFGLGCRNVAKAYVPHDFDLDRLFKALYPFASVAENNKYSNNYDYNRAIYLMEKQDFLENGFFIFKKAAALHAPVAVLHYEVYQDLERVTAQLESQANEIQCVVGKEDLPLETVNFGNSQKPALWDYADKVDLIEFLSSIKA